MVGFILMGLYGAFIGEYNVIEGVVNSDELLAELYTQWFVFMAYHLAVPRIWVGETCCVDGLFVCWQADVGTICSKWSVDANTGHGGIRRQKLANEFSISRWDFSEAHLYWLVRHTIFCYLSSVVGFQPVINVVTGDAMTPGI